MRANMPVRSAATHTRHGAFGFLAREKTCRPVVVAISGSAVITGMRLSDGERLQLACQRELMIADLRDARSSHRATCSIRADLGRITARLLET